MKSTFLLTLFALICTVMEITAQESFDDKNLALLEKIANEVDFSTIERFMTDQNCDFVKTVTESSNIDNYIFKASKGRVVEVRFTASKILFSVTIEVPTSSMVSVSSELEVKKFFQAPRENLDNIYKKKGYFYQFYFKKSVEPTTVMVLLTMENPEYDNKTVNASDDERMQPLLSALSDASKGNFSKMLSFQTQSSNPAESLVLYTSEGKIGFKDARGKVVTPALYENVQKIKDKYYLVEKDNKFGVIDDQGIVKIDVKYQSIYDELDGQFLVVNEDSKWSTLDVNGTVIMPFIDTPVLLYAEGIWISRKIYVKYEEDKYGLIDKWGKEIIAPKYKYLRPCSEGIISGELDGKWGYIKKNGEPLTPFIYTGDSRSFSEGLAVVVTDKKRGYIDHLGKVALPHIYDRAYSFYKGVAIVKMEDKFFLINKKGKKVKELKYDNFYRLPNENVINVTLNEKIGRIDISTGEEIIPPIYDNMDSFQRDLSAWVQLDNKWGVIDKMGEVIVPFKYDKQEILMYKNYIYKVKQNSKFGLFNADNVALTQVKYDSISRYNEGFALVVAGGKYGFIDLLGKEMSTLKYSHGASFSEGVAPVVSKGSLFFLNAKGEELAVLNKEVNNVQWVASFQEGLCAVKIADKVGFVNKSGQLKISPKYDEVKNFERGYAQVGVNNKWGLVDAVGKEIIALEYDEVYVMYDEKYIKVIKNGEELFFDRKGQAVADPY